MTVEIPLSKGRVSLIDDADWPEVRAYCWHISSDHKGRTGYAVSSGSRGKPPLPLHRLLMNPAKGEVVDHINGDTLDNRRANLRVCTAAENLRNRRRSINNTSGYKGVTKQKGSTTWRVALTIGGKPIALGAYPTAIEAAIAYDKAARVHHGEFASLNFKAERDWLLPYAVAA